jgi:D-sedoheptulose 7-phosphate isomerase
LTTEYTSFISNYCSDAAAVASSVEKHSDELLKLIDTLFKAAKAGGRIYTFGNGGSACDAMHMAEELVARYLRERPGIRAQHLIDSGTITCWGNDYEFDTIFSRQVETLATDKDVVIGFTTSGNSPNVCKALQAANEVGAYSIAMCGKTGGKAKAIAKQTIVVESELTSHIQEAHMMMIHIICDILEQRLFPECVSLDKPPKLVRTSS